MSVSTSISKKAECECPPAAMGKIPDWADYEEDVVEGRIKDMDEPLPSREPARDESSPEPQIGDDCSNSSSLCTTIAPANPDYERLTAMLRASAAANQASLLPPRGLNPTAPAFVMRVTPPNPLIQAKEKEVDNKLPQADSRWAECQEKGDIQGQIDLIVAGFVPQSKEDDIQKWIDYIVDIPSLKDRI
ncbi:hypothetical protein ONS95_010488 [Cadophora gregata]|uniref:uncharacterized protein n=1 Tax=Cadophora gregata TaxID=51156 RepID=UPI0026DBC113|nr:uncharacterized protein ONS95_010488 [Cadophora gregata]KAK0122235.1 hypothetical protein ONS95_010488 [Cadophora gregata]KAK0127713.1 hypothetical protein ONS96_007228 [Cadophora gregata f. sp. sojae]